VLITEWYFLLQLQFEKAAAAPPKAGAAQGVTHKGAPPLDVHDRTVRGRNPRAAAAGVQSSVFAPALAPRPCALRSMSYRAIRRTVGTAPNDESARSRSLVARSSLAVGDPVITC
jgi:hypothetical protein